MSYSIYFPLDTQYFLLEIKLQMCLSINSTPTVQNICC